MVKQPLKKVDMESTIQFVHAKQNKYVANLILDKLSELSHKFEWLIRAEVFLKEERDTHYGKGKICEIELSLPGPRIFASSNEESFEAAAAETIEELEVQLKKRKFKLYQH